MTDATLTWAAALDRYQDYLRARRSAARTIDGHSRDLARLPDLAPAPAEVTLQQLRQLQLDLLAKPLSPGTVAKITSTVRAFFRFLVDEGLLDDSPAQRLERPSLPRRVSGDVLTVREVEKLLVTAGEGEHGLLHRAIVETLYSTGLRRNELLHLDVSDFNRPERTLHVRAGKGEKDRLLPTNRACAGALEEWIDHGRAHYLKVASAALFLTTRGNRLHEVGLLRILRRLKAASGIKKRLTPHALRRSFATHLLLNKTHLKVIQALLGHENLATTSVYLRLDTSELRREILLRHPRERFDA